MLDDHPMALIAEYYEAHSMTYRILTEHSRRVADKAIEVAHRVPHLKPDIRFIEEAALLHDIGIFMTLTPELGCMGAYPYVCHGVLGRQLLEAKGLNRHALVCERHVGVGISVADIQRFELPLPLRDMLPLSIEEQIVCYADKFYSKTLNGFKMPKTLEQIRHSLEPYGQDKIKRFDQWVALFER